MNNLNNNKSNSSSDPSLLKDFYGSKSFLKIYQCLDINKIRFSFVIKGDEKNPIDVYISVEEFHADLMTKYRSGLLEKRRRYEIERKRNDNDQYYKDIWASRAGKSSQGFTHSFTIQPGEKTTYLFKANEYGGNGQSRSRYITVGVADKDLIILDFRWSFLFDDYKKVLAERYSLKNMKSLFSVSREEYMDYDESGETENIPQGQASQPKSSSQRGSNGQNNQKPFSMGENDISSTPAAQNNNQQPKGSNQSEIPKGEVKYFKLKVSTPIIQLEKSKNYALEGYTADNIKFSVIFPRNLLNEKDPFYDICCNAGKMITFRGIAQNNRIYATSIK